MLRFDRPHFFGAKAPIFLHFMQKTKENAAGTEAASPPEYPARFCRFSRKITPISRVMRLDPDLTQTGLKTRWIY